MNLSDPGLLICGMLVSSVGLGLFMYGKNTQNLRNLVIGLVMMIYPIFVASMLWMLLAAAACVAGVFILPDEF